MLKTSLLKCFTIIYAVQLFQSILYNAYPI